MGDVIDREAVCTMDAGASGTAGAGEAAFGEARPSDLVLAGHSHIVALGVPHCTGGPPEFIRISNGPPRMFAVAEKWVGDRLDPYWDLVARHAAGRTVALAWNGNQHNASFLIAPAPLFDFVCPGAATAGLHPRAVVLPAGVVRAYFRHTLIALGGLVRRMQASGARQVVILGTPAPKGDGDFILAHVRSEAYFQDAARAAGIDLATCAITPAPVRQKLWTLIQHMMAEIAAAEGALFLAVPPDTLDADGTLRREYWQDDSTHANAAYGATVRAGLERLAGNGTTQP